MIIWNLIYIRFLDTIDLPGPYLTTIFADYSKNNEVKEDNN